MEDTPNASILYLENGDKIQPYVDIHSLYYYDPFDNSTILRVYKHRPMFVDDISVISNKFITFAPSLDNASLPNNLVTDIKIDTLDSSGIAKEINFESNNITNIFSLYESNSSINEISIKLWEDVKKFNDGLKDISTHAYDKDASSLVRNDLYEVDNGFVLMAISEKELFPLVLNDSQHIILYDVSTKVITYYKDLVNNVEINHEMSIDTYKELNSRVENCNKYDIKNFITYSDITTLNLPATLSNVYIGENVSTNFYNISTIYNVNISSSTNISFNGRTNSINDVNIGYDNTVEIIKSKGNIKIGNNNKNITIYGDNHTIMHDSSSVLLKNSYNVIGSNFKNIEISNSSNNTVLLLANSNIDDISTLSTLSDGNNFVFKQRSDSTYVFNPSDNNFNAGNSFTYGDTYYLDMDKFYRIYLQTKDPNCIIRYIAVDDTITLDNKQVLNGTNFNDDGNLQLSVDSSWNVRADKDKLHVKLKDSTNDWQDREISLLVQTDFPLSKSQEYKFHHTHYILNRQLQLEYNVYVKHFNNELVAKHEYGNYYIFSNYEPCVSSGITYKKNAQQFDYSATSCGRYEYHIGVPNNVSIYIERIFGDCNQQYDLDRILAELEKENSTLTENNPFNEQNFNCTTSEDNKVTEITLATSPYMICNYDHYGSNDSEYDIEEYDYDLSMSYVSEVPCIYCSAKNEGTSHNILIQSINPFIPHDALRMVFYDNNKDVSICDFYDYQFSICNSAVSGTIFVSLNVDNILNNVLYNLINLSLFKIFFSYDYVNWKEISLETRFALGDIIYIKIVFNKKCLDAFNTVDLNGIYLPNTDAAYWTIYDENNNDVYWGLYGDLFSSVFIEDFVADDRVIYPASEHPDIPLYFAYMFAHTSIVHAPSLNNAHVNSFEYFRMFYCCSNLIIPPDLPIDAPNNECEQCCFEMFKDSGIAKFPNIKCWDFLTLHDMVDQDSKHNFKGIFDGCSSLSILPVMLALDCNTDIFNLDEYTYYLLDNKYSITNNLYDFNGFDSTIIIDNIDTAPISSYAEYETRIVDEYNNNNNALFFIYKGIYLDIINNNIATIDADNCATIILNNDILGTLLVFNKIRLPRIIQSNVKNNLQPITLPDFLKIENIDSDDADSYTLYITETKFNRLFGLNFGILIYDDILFYSPLKKYENYNSLWLEYINSDASDVHDFDFTQPYNVKYTIKFKKDNQNGWSAKFDDIRFYKYLTNEPIDFDNDNNDIIKINLLDASDLSIIGSATDPILYLCGYYSANVHIYNETSECMRFDVSGDLSTLNEHCIIQRKKYEDNGNFEIISLLANIQNYNHLFSGFTTLCHAHKLHIPKSNIITNTYDTIIMLTEKQIEGILYLIDWDNKNGNYDISWDEVFSELTYCDNGGYNNIYTLKNVLEMYSGMFENCTNLITAPYIPPVINDELLALTHYQTEPNLIDYSLLKFSRNYVISINDSLFYNCNSLRKIYPIEERIEEFCEEINGSLMATLTMYTNAFEGCYSLTNIKVCNITNYISGNDSIKNTFLLSNFLNDSDNGAKYLNKLILTRSTDFCGEISDDKNIGISDIPLHIYINNEDDAGTIFVYHAYKKIILEIKVNDPNISYLPAEVDEEEYEKQVRNILTVFYQAFYTDYANSVIEHMVNYSIKYRCIGVYLYYYNLKDTNNNNTILTEQLDYLSEQLDNFFESPPDFRNYNKESFDNLNTIDTGYKIVLEGNITLPFFKSTELK